MLDIRASSLHNKPNTAHPPRLLPPKRAFRTYSIGPIPTRESSWLRLLRSLVIRTGQLSGTGSQSVSFTPLIAGNRRWWKCVVALEVLGLAVALPVACLLAVILLDQWLHLSILGRVLAFAGVLVGLAAATGYLVRCWAVRLLHGGRGRPGHGTTDPRRRPQPAHQRRAAGGVSGPGAQELSRAVVAENVAALQQLRLEKAAQARSALLCSCAGLGALLVGAGLWLWHAESFTNSMARILMPLASIEPVYRTTLTVEPGDVAAAGDVPIRVIIQGERPSSLILFRNAAGHRSTEVIPVPAEAGQPVPFVLKDVVKDTEYAVRGNDFTSPTYRVTVPRQTGFTRLRVTYAFPAYTGLGTRSFDAATGDLEALQGTLRPARLLL